MSYCKIQPAKIEYMDHASLMDAWSRFCNNFSEDVLIGTITVSKPLTRTQALRLPVALRSRMPQISEWVNAD